MATMSAEARAKFLDATRYGYLTTLTGDGSPRTVPVWYDWDGHSIRIFTGKGSPKVKRIRQDPRITVLVANDRHESEAWVAFDGQAEIRTAGATRLMGMLAARYWDLSDPKKQAVLEAWQSAPEEWCLIELVPTQILSYG